MGSVSTTTNPSFFYDIEGTIRLYDPKLLKTWDNYVDVNNDYDIVKDHILNANRPIKIEGGKGTGKTLLVHTICKDIQSSLIEISCTAYTKERDLLGSYQLNDKGQSYFKLGKIPLAYLCANKYGHATLLGDDIHTQDPDVMAIWHSVCDKRKYVYAGGKKYELNKDSKLAIVFTTNPHTDMGAYRLSDPMLSRVVGRVMYNPQLKKLEKIPDWKDIPDTVKDALLTLSIDSNAMKRQDIISYELSPRDVCQFTDQYRDYLKYYKVSVEEKEKPHRLINSKVETVLEETIKTVILTKYVNPDEREHILKRCEETFNVEL